MLQWLRHLSRNVIVKARRVARENNARNRWLDEARRTSLVHESIEFKGLDPEPANLKIGSNCCLERDVSVWLSNDPGADAKLAIGDGVYVGRNTFLGCYQPLKIGDNALIGAYSYITSGNHGFARRDVTINSQGFTGSPIEIGPDVWIGAHVTILPGVVIGKGAILGAGSLVNKDIPEYQIWAGVPAKFIRQRPGGGE
jgi:acetyltransferase-like isoleucine patch superfamily enzyme